MNLEPRSASRPLALLALLALLLPAHQARAAGVVGKWLGQDGHDLVGGPGQSKNDYQDVHIALKGLPANREVVDVVIRGHGSGEWNTSNKERFTVLVVRAPRSTSADLYFEPDRREVGREFEIKLKFDDGQGTSLLIQGGKADPNLRAAGAGIEAKWLGQDGHDHTGLGPSVGPDGFEDVHLALSKLSGKAEIKAVEVIGPGGPAWHSGVNARALPHAELIRHDDKTRADLFFSPGRDLAGQTLKVAVTYGDDRGDVVSVAATRCNPTRAMPKVTASNLANGTATARWLGQDGIQTALGDVHVVLEGLAPPRQIVAAALSDGVVATWVYRSNDRVKFEAGPAAERLQVRRGGPKADLAFPPIRDESGATMTLRLLDQSGREEVIRFPGGPCDPGRRAPAIPPGAVTAKPGDDLHELVTRPGTVTLSKGIYPLSKPLVLPKAVHLIGEPGATLRFSQGGSQPPWTAAIKVHAGGTTLEGFAVRFEGPVRWDREVSFGPSVIGTTDNRDGNVPEDPKHRITLARLDLQGPPASSAWEEATHLIRVVSAASGRIEKNTLKGGAVVFAGGPWTIAENSYKGTLPSTFSYGLFSARYVHDLVLVGNKARDEGPSGKTWRFLVLAQRGVNDLIKDNVVEGGIGPREDDSRPHENNPEVILTEAYRLHFEGKPASISPDGRVVVIPRPQGGPAGTGDALAILSGPQAGQWRTIAQPLSPHAYLLDEPIARETDALSIATGFVRETFEGNTVDCRGSGIAADLVLAGNLFGVKVLRNHLLGGGMAIRLLATPTEEPVHWGWSHAPFLGGLFEGNILEDAPEGGIGVEHSAAIKSTKGRAYMSLTMKDNTFRWSRASGASAKPPKLEIGFPPSLDPKELVISEEGTKLEGAPPQAAWVHAATINGKVVREAPLTTRAGP